MAVNQEMVGNKQPHKPSTSMRQYDQNPGSGGDAGTVRTLGKRQFSQKMIQQPFKKVLTQAFSHMDLSTGLQGQAATVTKNVVKGSKCKKTKNNQSNFNRQSMNETG